MCYSSPEEKNKTIYQSTNTQTACLAMQLRFAAEQDPMVQSDDEITFGSSHEASHFEASLIFLMYAVGRCLSSCCIFRQFRSVFVSAVKT